MPYSFSWKADRIIPASVSDVLVVDTARNPANLAAPTTLSDGVVTVTVQDPGTYVLVFDNGQYQHLVKFDAETGATTQMYGYQIYPWMKKVGGPLATVRMGTVTTTEPGSQASATILATPDGGETLNLSIPRGSDVSQSMAIAFAIAL